jgi:diguanylate cyclase (GGDEF)-like protein/PAS domain S-box-containing protein
VTKTDKVIRLLTIKESSNDAEAIASAMRNAGYAIRSSNVEDGEDLREALEQQAWDLIISSLTLPEFGAVQALEMIRETGKDIPVIVTTPQYSDEAAVEVMQAGGRELLPDTNYELLLLVIARELADLEERRGHRHAKTMYRESEKRNRSLMDSSRDAIAYIHEGMHIYTNATYLEMFGHAEAADVEGIPIMDMISSEHQQQFKGILRQLSSGETPEGEIEMNLIRADGAKFAGAMVFAPASIEGEPCTQVIIRSKSDNKALEKELDALRRQDLLTGLFNRNHFTEQLDAAIKAATDENASRGSTLLYIEPDDFKQITETVGVAASDLVLSDIATIIKNNVGANDVAARYSNEVFTVLLAETDPRKVKSIADKIIKDVANHTFELEGESITTTCSVGAVQITETSADVRKVLSQVDIACKQAKAGGGNQLHVHTAADEKASNERDLEWIRRIKVALEKDRFRLLYQPIVSLHAEPGERYEVLLRMLGEQNQDIAPGEFLELAERAGLMPDIDKWVTKQSVKMLATKRNTHAQTRFFIKISHDTLKDQTFLVWLSKLLKAARLHGASLIFEAGESSVLSALKETKLFINGLKQLHCEFAIDHVGSETQSFSYLKHLDVKYLKIDGAHITDLVGNDKSREMVKLIADMAKADRRMVIAEHVQDANVLAVLWQTGVNFIQGYYLQKPEDAMTYDFTPG